jgi:hypothetical protein
MSKTWKWIIGILIALAVLSICVAVPIGFHLFAGRYAQQFRAEGIQQGDNNDFGPGMMWRGQGGENDFGPGMMRRGQGGYEGYYGPGMMGRGYGYPGMMGGFFFPFGGLFMGLIGLAVLGLAVYGVVALFNRRPAAQAPVVSPAAVSPVATHPCASCGKPAQDDWKTCPYCGNALETQ